MRNLSVERVINFSNFFAFECFSDYGVQLDTAGSILVQELEPIIMVHSTPDKIGFGQEGFGTLGSPDRLVSKGAEY